MHSGEGVCLSLGSFKVRLLDTMQVKVVYFRGGCQRHEEGDGK